MKPECWNSFQTNLAIQYSTRVDWSYIDRKIFFFHAPAFEQDRIWSLCQKNDLKMGSQNFLIFNAVCVPVKIFNLHIEIKCKIGIFWFIVNKKILFLSFELLILKNIILEHKSLCDFNESLLYGNAPPPKKMKICMNFASDIKALFEMFFSAEKTSNQRRWKYLLGNFTGKWMRVISNLVSLIGNMADKKVGWWCQFLLSK